MESHFSSDTGKPQARIPSPDRPGVDGMGQPLLDIPIKEANKGRIEDFQLESFVTAITGAKLKRIRPRGKSRGKEYLDAHDRSDEVLGKRGLNNRGMDSPKSSQFQPSGQLKGTDAGDNRACDDNYGRSGGSQETTEGVGMEFSEQDESSPPI